jgi:ribosomal protein S18 acetylase RimI-like enzyme
MPALGRLFITPADLERKVSIRYRSAGQLTDVVGKLINWQDEKFTVLNKHDKEVSVAALEIVAAKVVAPEVSAAWVQSMALRVWQAKETEQLGDWVLQATGGATSRVNSALLVGLPSESVDVSLQKVIDWYQAKDLTPLVHLSSPGIFDTNLKKLDFKETHLIDFLTKKAASTKPEIEFIVEDSLSSEWLRAVNQNNGEGRKVDDFTLKSGDFVRYLSLQTDGKISGTARIAAESGFALVTNLWVSEANRNQKIAQNLMQAVEYLAVSVGIEQVWLQVLHSNLAAQNLYRKIGYQTHHQYRYWAYSPERH